MYTNPAWFMENETGSFYSEVLLEKRMFICEETLWLQLWHGLTLVNTSVLFNEILYDPVAFDSAQTSDLLSADVANISHWYLYCEIWQTDQICHKIVMFPRKDLSSQIIVCLFFFQLLFLFKCGKKTTNIVPFLPCLYLFQSVNSVVLTPLHGLRKLSLQQTAIPRSITGLFRSSHRGLLAKKTLLILFSAGQREERGWFAENLNNNTFQTIRHHIVVEGSACPDDPQRCAVGEGSAKVLPR